MYLQPEGPVLDLASSTSMPPAQEMIKTRPFSDDRHPAPDLAYLILSLSIIFVSGSFVACLFFVRPRRPMRGHALLCTTFGLPALQLRGVRAARKRASFSPTVSVLVEQSTIVASSPLNLNISPNFRPPSTLDSLKRSVSWGRATVRSFGLTALTSTLAASIQQNFSRFINLIASAPTATSDNDGSCYSCTAALLDEQPVDSGAKERPGPLQHHSGSSELVTDTEKKPELDIRVANAIHIPQILFSTEDAQFKTETPMMPLIILSLPSSEHLVVDASPATSLNEDLLSPDGTFRSTSRSARTLVDIHNISDGTRLALASRLRERRKRPVSLPSNLFATTGKAHWPRWF
ncbi:hypothetical protein BC827DRAFT_1154626 [Russula dissimulans]|nr:hypothetical protein BC827DRAFT_1154626 [Russula dissimulans]